ncbi:MAG: hotdog fold domain-containing protein [Nocardioides sp.]|jgi:hypothetical protein
MNLLALWTRLSALPQGDRLFSFVFGQKAPYFSTIRPLVREVRPNHVEVLIKKRRRVHNHIKTVHVIAICNGLEMAMGALAEATIPRDKRWIPKGMEVSYPAKADTDIRCFAETDAAQWTADDPDLPVRVWAERADGTVVVEGVIKLWVTPKTPKSSKR